MPLSRSPSPTLSDSELLDSLQDDFDFESHREARMESIAREVKQLKDLRESEYGKIFEFAEEKALIERMAKEKYCLIHFYHPDFQRCQIMDNKLAELAPSHLHTLFLRTSVDNAPFLVAKMAVKVLPCVMCYVNGRAVDRLIGFEELGQTDNFTTKMLEFRLQQSGVLPSDLSMANNLFSLAQNKTDYAGYRENSDDDQWRTKSGKSSGRSGIRNGTSGRNRDSDEDDDW
ncbi:uncharacterized protein L203_100031 [Cryptococcus depauperatus CBS 7841]|uniref:Thioredoxin domain-containing protein n=1 Tax=Cryptococcus depauperatus CBS 7841 TaxID=1295531 RepID=A0AAJ8LV17_9TREE